MTDKLHLRVVTPKPRLQLVWIRRPDGVLACGPVTIEYRRAKPPSEWYDPIAKDAWYTLVDGVVACRNYGYATERDAMRVASHLEAVRKMMK